MLSVIVENAVVSLFGTFLSVDYFSLECTRASVFLLAERWWCVCVSHCALTLEALTLESWVASVTLFPVWLLLSSYPQEDINTSVQTRENLNLQNKQLKNQLFPLSSEKVA